MPKKKGKSSRKVIIGIILVIVVAVAIIGWHDGLVGVTPIGDINDFSVDTGTAITVKGEIILILGNLVTVQDSTGAVGFSWADSDSLSLHQIVVVRGIVGSFITLTDVTSVAPVWLIA